MPRDWGSKKKVEQRDDPVGKTHILASQRRQALGCFSIPCPPPPPHSLIFRLRLRQSSPPKVLTVSLDSVPVAGRGLVSRSILDSLRATSYFPLVLEE